MLNLDTNAGEVASGLSGLVVEATATADEEAARTALALIRPRTPVRTGRLVGGLEAVVVPAGGFDVVDAVEYATAVDARTGFATRTLAAAGDEFADIYDRHLQTRMDQLP